MNKLENLKYIGYNYKEISIKKKAVSLYVDNYCNFGWMISYPVYSLVKKWKILSLTPLIDEQYNCIDNICQKVNAFIMK